MIFEAITFDMLIYVSGALIFFILLLLFWNIRTEMRLRKILLGKNAKSLEGTIVALGEEIQNIHAAREETEEYLRKAEKRMRRSIQGVATVRFNPFKGTGSGGNQSFATAFVDEHGNGVVISSLYSRERMSVYAKPLNKYKSEFELTVEEKEALVTAKQSLNS